MKEVRKKIRRTNRFVMAVALVAFGFAMERLGAFSFFKKYVSPVKEARADTAGDNSGDPNGGACSNGSGGDW
jgi:hypothetical protein